ncbi:zinc finger protein Aiolos-like [Chrysoperla carnea]|uniref:zinc finger protein Aiolos-like n=1 Tax=Chrysoperla carnea TaxID=189513 RepID=UPI001D086683|nr:zinc finger protein Aiolos-like [Chrysoperla carnea]
MENRKYICGHIFDDNEPITINTNAPSLQYVITNSDGQKVCNFGCVSKSDLRKHRLIHSNVKPFSCNFCPMSFRQTGHLRRHIKRHTGKRDFICNICSVGFVTKDNLKNHLPIHENVLPYICEHCGKTLLQRSQCVRHVAKCSMLQVKNSDVDNKSDKVNEKD